MRYFMQKPVLGIGIILFGLFITQLSRDGNLNFLKRDKLQRTSCDAVIVKLEKAVPSNWKVFCEGNNLAAEINEVMIPPEASNLQALLYRQLANHLSFIARTSYTEILERVMFIRIKMIHPKMEINAVTEGQYVVKLATLETPEHIMAHLQSTVQVKETVK